MRLLQREFWTSPDGRKVLLTLGGFAGTCVLILGFFYARFSHLIESRLRGELAGNISRVFTAPRLIAVGEATTPETIASYLERAGLSRGAAAASPRSAGYFVLQGAGLEIRPSARSYFGGANALRVEFSGRRISRIRQLDGGASVASAEIEPEVLTNLFDESREKKRPVSFADLPKPLLQAVLAAEDRRFFDHPGFDPIRVLGAAWADLRSGAKAQGASTLTMQVARSFFFSTRREWSRKAAETFMALLLEQKFTKKEIFELYANQIYLGNRDSFAIRGFGEAAQAYFGSDVRQLNLAQAAFLAGIIRAPNRYSSPERRPERSIEARDRVLGLMVENKAISPAAAEAARKLPLGFVTGTLDRSSSAYFVDLVKDELLDRFSGAELARSSCQVYTTLDAGLEHAAAEAIRIGMQNVDAALARRARRSRSRRAPPEPAAEPAQVALVALDARTGAIRALVGGRDYGASQLNHTLARRQPGSAFKPFVYGAAFQGALDGVRPVITPATRVVDEPTTFFYDNKQYAPNNYGQEFHGPVTVREALTLSLNVATVKVAEMIGYQRVADWARRVGIKGVEPTPSLALGAYEMTPLEVAAAYTVFPTNGMRAEPFFLDRVVGPVGTVWEQKPSVRRALDARVAYLVTELMVDVINRGTGAGVRAHGFTAPAAGKTGTSHDGWFAGFTSNLVCAVWVGFDDNRELGLSGAAAAAPIWAEFMKRAVASSGYRDPQPFMRPAGIASVTIDPESGELAVAGGCPASVDEVFIAGTEPATFCALHGGNGVSRFPPFTWLSRIFGGRKRQPETR